MDEGGTDLATPAKTTTALPREIWILVSAAFLIAVGYGLIAPILPQFVVSFDVTMAAAGLVVAVFSVSRLVFAPVSGRLIDAVGSRRVYLTGLFTVAIATGLIAFAEEYWHILALRAIAGVGSTMFTVSAMGLIVRLSPPKARGRASAVYGSAFLLGNVIGPVVGAALSFLGMRWPFIIYAIGVCAAAGVVMRFMPATSHKRPAQREALAPLTVREAWKDTAFRAALASNMAHGWVNMGVRVSVLPLFAAGIFVHGGAMAGLALAAFAAGNALCLQFSGTLADTYGRKPLIVWGLFGSAIFVGAMGWVETVFGLLAMSLCAGAFAGLLNPSQQAVLADVIGNKRSGGTVLSTYQMAMDAGQIVGPVLVGWAADAFGFRYAFALCALVAAMALVAWLPARETLGSR
ncbi:MFS transporter [Corynebacterium tapiri]|uniref:MFS transporter n=1 Tax=Corynebacterium tapiri TaxID=1448266 RepID=A0A5C4U613_9CORY|nr:MFS transporter [Corynebacterium tapiri]TNL99688.1 MFS transporter [Corynebacterium tapiri]